MPRTAGQLRAGSGLTVANSLVPPANGLFHKIVLIGKVVRKLNLIGHVTSAARNTAYWSPSRAAACLTRSA